MAAASADGCGHGCEQDVDFLKLTCLCSQGSDEESDVDDEEREVEAYDRQLADAE